MYERPFRPINVQRLRPPRDVWNSFAFGGGLRNGGLSDEAVAMLKDVWSYDYMGAAEFEFGDLAKSIEYISENLDEFVWGEMEVDVKQTVIENKKERIVTKTGMVYYMCRNKHHVEVVEWLKASCEKEQGAREYVGLGKAILMPEWEIRGWHDINLHFMFFTDEAMYNKLKVIFGKTVKEETG